MNKHQNLFKRTLLHVLLIIFIPSLWYFCNIPLVSSYLHDIELKTYDLLFITRHNLNLDTPPPKNIVIVGIDAESINKVGLPWPWPRQFHASLVDSLSKAHAKLIVFDVIFDTISPLSLQTEDILGTETIGGSSYNEGIEDDNIFASSIKKAMNVILACEAEPISNNSYRPILPISQYLKALDNNAGFLGNVAVTYDNDNFVRGVKLIFPEFYKDPAISSSLSLRAALKSLNVDSKILPDNTIKLGNKIIPGEFLINFYGPSETIETISYWQTLELISQNQIEKFKNKIVLIGRTKLKASIDPFKSIRSPDTFPTPYSAITPNFSGVELQAAVIGNIINHSYIVKATPLILLLIFISTGIMSIFIISVLRQKLILCFYAITIFSVFYILSAFASFLFLRVYIPPTFPVYAIILPGFLINFLDQYFIVDRARRRQAKIFRQLVPSQVADEIERMDQDQLALGGSKKEITVLFSDIKNFTGMCEKYPPEIIVTILNQFFTEMVKIIHKYNGLVDKFIGDAIMAIWGSPKIIDKEKQAELASICALAMKAELENLNQHWERTGLTEYLSIRIGINTDSAVTGNIGSLQRMQFSAVGDGVNVASRLEGVNKIYGTSILISRTTKDLLNNSILCREIDTVIVPGKDTAIDIFELIEKTNYNPEVIKSYETALKCYRNKDFEEAINSWGKCLVIDKSDKASKVMLERTTKLQQLKSNSLLPHNWQPIWNIENK